MNKVKIVLTRGLNAKKRKIATNLVFKIGLSTKMNSHDHRIGAKNKY